MLPKHSEQELRGMSTALLRYKIQQPEVYLIFIQTTAIATGTTPEFIEQKIKEYASESSS